MTVTFRKFLFENSNITTYSNIKSFAEDVKANCSEFLSVNKSLLEDGHFLYRGFSSLDKTRNLFFSYTPRRDRKPLTTNKIIHKLYDDYFLNKFNFRYRSQSAFSTLSKVAADNFASESGIFVVFPKNGYTMAVSNQVEDLFTLSSEVSKKLDLAVDKYLDAKTNDEQQTSKDLVFKAMDKLQYFETKSLTDITFKPAEILIQTDRLYAIARSSSKAGYFFSENGDHIRLADLLYE